MVVVGVGGSLVFVFGSFVDPVGLFGFIGLIVLVGIVDFVCLVIS